MKCFPDGGSVRRRGSLRRWRDPLFRRQVSSRTAVAVAASVVVVLSGALDSLAMERDGQEPDDVRHAQVDAWIDRELPTLLDVYRHLHANPELSLEEEETSALVAATLREVGYVVETGVGGYGVLGVLHNGAGPRLLIRGDMDALPVVEATGLPYASRVRTTNSAGVTVGVMHACGHDVHVTNLLGTARLLAEIRDDWRGTLVILAQPAEELGKGALHMIEDGLFDRIALPDHGIALHVDAGLQAGSIGYVSGWAAANVDLVKIKIHGRGGHGARPHEAIDPIVMSAQLVMALQTIVSRRVDPSESAVVTVGSIHGGAKSNVIPDEVKLELTVRSYSNEVRALLLTSIEEIAAANCEAFACPRPPEVWIKPEYTPAMWNDPDLVQSGIEVFRRLLGNEKVLEISPTMTGEDFGRYTRSRGFPTFLYRLGAVSHDRMEASLAGGEPLPSLHSSLFAPDAKLTIRTGIRSMSRLALSLLDRPTVD